jgi:hypothetical protein
VAGGAPKHPSLLVRLQTRSPGGKPSRATSTPGAPARGTEEAVKVKPSPCFPREAGDGGRAHDPQASPAPTRGRSEGAPRLKMRVRDEGARVQTPENIYIFSF